MRKLTFIWAYLYVCSEERTVMHCAVLTRMEVRAPLTSSSGRVGEWRAVWNLWTGLLDWNTGMA